MIPAAAALLLAIEANDYCSLMKVFVDYPDYRIRAERDGSLLDEFVIAASQGQADIFRALLVYGAPVDYSDKKGQTALRVASASGHADTIAVLLNFRASKRVGADGCSPLRLATRGSHLAAIRLLIDRGVYVEACDASRFMALHEAAKVGSVETLELLLESGADINSKTQYAGNALHIASQYGRASAIAFLLKRGLSERCMDSNGFVPIHLAALSPCPQSIDVLFELGADVNAPFKYGLTALHLACQSRLPQSVSQLLAAGANWRSLDMRGKTAEEINDCLECKLILKSHREREILMGDELSPPPVLSHRARKI